MAKSKRQKKPGPDGRIPSATSTPSARRTRFSLFWALAIALAAVAVYSNALGDEFVLDDTRIVRDNVRIRSLTNVPALFASSYWGTEGTQALYRPLVLVSFAFNYAVNGLSTSGYTIVNIALHAAVSVLVFLIVRGIGGSLLAAGISGLAFAVHPVHTEAVAAIAGRTELLAALFFLLTICLHRRAPAASRPAVMRSGAMACFACALLSKESAITLVLVLPVMDALFPAPGRDRRPAGSKLQLLSVYAPLAAVALIYLAVRRAVLGGLVISEGVIAPLDNPLVPIATMPLGERMGATPAQAVMTAFAVVAEYARLLAWPARLSPDYSYNQIPLVTSVGDARFIAGAAIVASCLAGIVLLWRRSPIAAFGLAFLALTFSIVSNFVVTIGTICAERLMYLPSAGALVAAAVGVEQLALAPARRRIVLVAIAVVLMAGAARTWTRNREWASDASLWSAAIAVAPGSARVQAEYGRVLMGLGDREAQAGRNAAAERYYAAAQTHFEIALKIYPSYSPPMDGLATLLSLHQRFDEAVVWYERAVKVWPASYASVTNWGGLLWDRSRRLGSQAAELRAQGRTAEADVLTRQADAGFREAIEKIDKAIAMNPSYAHAHLLRALLMDAYVGDRAQAIAEFEQVLRLMPDHPQRSAIEQELTRLRSPQ